MTYTIKRTNKAGEPRFTGYYLLPEKRISATTGELVDHWVSAGTAATEAAALKLADAEQKKIDSGAKPDPEFRATATIATFVPYFLLKHACGQSTRDGHRRHLNKFVLPSLSSIKVVDLERTDIQSLLDRLGNPEKPQKPVPPATLKAIRSALSAMLGYAMRLGWVSENRAKNVSIPTVVRKTEQTWAPDVWTLFRKNLPTEGAELFGMLQAMTGARISELCAALVSDFRADGKLSITKALVVANIKTAGANHVINDRPKNGRDRLVSLPVIVRRMLNEWIEAHNLGPDDLLFPRALVAPRGGTGPLTPRTWSGIFNRAFAASGLALYLRIPAKNVRHMNAVELLNRGWPPAKVAARLGNTKEILLTNYNVLALSVSPEDTTELDEALAAFAA